MMARVWWTLPFLVCLDLHDRTDAPRPELSGQEQVLVTDGGRFALHYTVEGSDAVGGVLADDGVPELVHEAAEALVFAEEEFLARGYRPLVGDDGEGGSEALDVYVLDIDANGYANPILDGPDGASCFMQLDHDLFIPGVMRSVAIHELHHCVQYRYTTSAHSWIYEATATFEQYRAYLNLALEAAVIVLWQTRLQEPETPMAQVDGDYEYAGLVPMLFWEQYAGGGSSRLPDLWEALAVDPVWQDAFDAESRRVFGLSWDELFLEYATWNAFACAYDDGGHYDPSLLPCNELVGVPVEPLEWEGEVALFEVPMAQGVYSARYFEIDDAFPDREVTLECNGPGKQARMMHRLVHVNAAGGRGANAWGPAGQDERPLVLAAGRPAQGTLRIVSASVGEAPVRRPDCLLVAREPEGGRACGCHSTRVVSGLAWLPLVLLARRRVH